MGQGRLIPSASTHARDTRESGNQVDDADAEPPAHAAAARDSPVS